jgi:hypothetical protein
MSWESVSSRSPADPHQNPGSHHPAPNPQQGEPMESAEYTTASVARCTSRSHEEGRSEPRRPRLAARSVRAGVSRTRLRSHPRPPYEGRAHPALDTLTADLDGGAVSVLLVSSLDRLGRSITDNERITAALRRRRSRCLCSQPRHAADRRPAVLHHAAPGGNLRGRRRGSLRPRLRTAAITSFSAPISVSPSVRPNEADASPDEVGHN